MFRASIISRLNRLGHQLSRRSRYQLTLLFLLMIFAAFSEIFSLGMMVPFLGVLLNPEGVIHNPHLISFVGHLDFMERDHLILGITGLFIGAVLFAAFIRVLLVWSQIRLAHSIGAQLSREVYRHILFQPYFFHARTNSSEVIASVSKKADQVVSDVILPCLVVSSSTILVLAIAGALATISPIVALSAAGSLGLIYCLVMLATKFRLTRYGGVINKQQAKVIKAIQESLGGIRDIIIDGAQEVYCKIYEKVDQPLRDAQANNLIIAGVPRCIIEGVAIALIAVFAGWLALEQGGLQAMIPVLGVLVLGAQKTLPLLQLAYVNFTQIQGSQAPLEDVLEILEKSFIAPDKNAVIGFKKEIHLNQIGYQYDPASKWVLQDISLEIKKGDRIGFIGTTGSGKSSLLDLIMGLVFPIKGQMLVDGVPINESNSGAWQRHIAHVPQSIYLTDSSALENIAFGIDPDDIDRQRVQWAAKQAQIAEVIEGWVDGYDTVLGERGARLSGGQRQRIGLARALYKNADVIVLDEATSALDQETEAAVMSAIKGLHSDVTVLIVAHRLTTLQECNKIVVIDDGKIERICAYKDIVAISSLKDAP